MAGSPKEEIVEIVSSLIQIDSTNTGELATTVGEAEVANYVVQLLEEVGFECEVIQVRDPKRVSVVTRLKGDGSNPDALVVHGHLDVVPAIASDWTVPPFSGLVKDGYVWGRGAVDMKNMVGMIIAVARELKRTHFVPKRDIIFVFFSDEESGSEYGSLWLAENRKDLFVGATEGISEVGGYTIRLPHARGGSQKFYTLATGEKGLAWMKITAHGTAGHGSLVNRDNPITKLAKAIERIGNYDFPIVYTDSLKNFIKVLNEHTELGIDLESDTLVNDLGVIGGFANAIVPTLRHNINPTMLDAGYKANVVPQTATAVLDCRLVPGPREEFEQVIDSLLGPDVTREWVATGDALEAPYATPFVDQMRESLREYDDEAVLLPYLLSACTDAKALAKHGIAGYGFSPLNLPEDFDYMSKFHGIDECVPIEALYFGVDVLESLLRKQ